MTETSFPKEWSTVEYGDALISASNGIGGKQNKAGIGIPVSRIETIANETINFERVGYLEVYDPNKISKHRLCTGDILFSHINSPAHLGKTALFDNEKELYHGINLLRLVVDRNILAPKLFNYHCRLLRNLGVFSQNAQHAVNQSSLNQKKLFRFSAPLPPLAEQKVIADKLDTLLAQVENTKARLERIPQILKRFRQSVLAGAVSGRLTEDWRIQEGLLSASSIGEIDVAWESSYRAEGKQYRKPNLEPPETEPQDLPRGWIWTQIGYVFDVHIGATPSRKEPSYWGGEVNWVSSAEVAFCRIKSTKEKITESGLANASTSLHPPGTVMLAMIGQGKTRGQPAILDSTACHNQNTAALRVPDEICVSEFLYYCLYERYEETRRVGSGNNQQAMNKKIVQTLPFPLPPRAEQAEIVRRVDQLFAHADRIEQQVNNALVRVNNLTQSILAKAFRGELTEQWRKDNPELISGGNSAEALLDRIKAERDATKAAPVKSQRHSVQ